MTGSLELSMVLEKAIVLLNGKEFSALRRILAEYEATEINIDRFADSLLQLIKDQEKVKPRLFKSCPFDSGLKSLHLIQSLYFFFQICKENYKCWTSDPVVRKIWLDPIL